MPEEISPEASRRFDQQAVVNDKLEGKIDCLKDTVSAGFTELKVHLEKQDAVADQTLAQATKTNGRVNELEGWKNKVEVEYSGFLKQLKEDSKDIRGKIITLIWKFVEIAIIVSLGLLGAKEWLIK